VGTFEIRSRMGEFAILCKGVTQRIYPVKARGRNIAVHGLFLLSGASSLPFLWTYSEEIKNFLRRMYHERFSTRKEADTQSPTRKSRWLSGTMVFFYQKPKQPNTDPKKTVSAVSLAVFCFFHKCAKNLRFLSLGR